ncbi:MAG: Fic family protein [Nitrosarchaeum sp.]
METSAFAKPSGQLVKNKESHITFLPDKLPPKIEYDPSIVALLSEASIQLGRLSGIGTLIPNPHLLIRPYVLREAVLSSKIEGTQASILDVFRFQAGGFEGSKDAESKRITEVVNYVTALDDCLEAVKKGNEIDLNMIKSAHHKLMNKVRGQELAPGEFRTVQNWIGVPGTKIEDATYVPPRAENITELLEDLVNFIKNPTDRIPVLLQCAIIHYQFEAIHPFGDGNGRIGRLLIPLLLQSRGLLSQPLLYISVYVEKNKTQYYNALLEVSKNSDWINWFKFFLMAVVTQAKDASDNIQKLMNLQESYNKKLRSSKVSASVMSLATYLFSNPIITIPTAATYLKITYPPAKNAINRLVKLGILEQNNRERNKTFAAREIIDILS